MLQGRDLIVFGEDFGRHPHCLEHVLRPLLPANRVLWVETIGLRSPRLRAYDLGRALGILRKWTRGAGATPPAFSSLTRLAPTMLPYNQWRPVRNWNRARAVASVQAAMDALRFRDPIVLASVPQAADFVDQFGASCIVYYCVDDFAAWPGVSAALARQMEETLIEKSDLCLATSEALCATRSTPQKSFALLTHGVDLEHFQLPARAPGPIRNLCCFGLIDERTDLELLAKIAVRFPECTLTLIGPRQVSVQGLRSFRNVVLKDAVPYEDLPRAISDQDLFLLPYVRNETTRSVNPLKLKEYMATGRPVVAVALPEVAKLAEYVHVAETPAEFLDHIAKLRAEPSLHRSEPALDYLRRSEAWQAKAEVFSGWVEDFEKGH